MAFRKSIQDIRSGYLSCLLHPPQLQKIVRNAVKQAPVKNYDSIAFRGMSGALVAPMIAIKLKKNLIMIRKDLTQCHSCSLVEGYSASKNYIIVDDFVESGVTAFEIYFAVKKFSPSSKCLGILVAADGSGGKHAEFISFSSLKKNYSYGWDRVRAKHEKQTKQSKARTKKKAKSIF